MNLTSKLEPIIGGDCFPPSIDTPPISRTSLSANKAIHNFSKKQQQWERRKCNDKFIITINFASYTPSLMKNVYTCWWVPSESPFECELERSNGVTLMGRELAFESSRLTTFNGRRFTDNGSIMFCIRGCWGGFFGVFRIRCDFDSRIRIGFLTKDILPKSVDEERGKVSIISIRFGIVSRIF